MKKGTSRFISFALALALCAALLPATARGFYDTGMAGMSTVICTGEYSMAAIDANGGLWTWGCNEFGQLGNGGTGDVQTEKPHFNYGGLPCYQTVPVKIMDDVVSISCNCDEVHGAAQMAAIKKDGSLWMWGSNRYGELGSSDIGDRTIVLNQYESFKIQTTPVKVMNNVAAVSVGYMTTAAIKTDGSLWMWGTGGNPSQKYSYLGGAGKPRKPVKVMESVAAVACGYDLAAALKTDGSLLIWGGGYWGELGNGTYKHDSLAPYEATAAQPFKVLDNVKTFSLGEYHVAAVKNDGSLWMWGSSNYGCLGNGGGGNIEVSSVPDNYYLQTVPLKVMENVSAVSCGRWHTAIIKTDGSLWTAGWVLRGALGNGDKGNYGQGRFEKVMGDVTAVSCGDQTTEVVQKNGTLWTFGDNTQGMLGNGGIGNDEYKGTACQTIPLKIFDNVRVPSASLVPSMSAPATPKVVPSPQKLAVNGKSVATEMYNIDGTNFFKLRDLAAMLDGTSAQFNVDFDAARNTIVITTGAPYTTSNGYELQSAARTIPRPRG